MSDPYDRVAALYDVYASTDDDLDFFRGVVAEAGGPVLELMAGTGRLSVPLVEGGARLVCVDRSLGMLAVLRDKLAARGLDTPILCQDVRELAFEPVFELAILPFQSFMELTLEVDQQAALRAIRGCLRAGGRFVCTLHNPAVRRRTVDGALRTVGSFETPEGTLVLSGIERGGDPVVQRMQFLELFGPDGTSRWRRLQPMAFSLIERGAFERLAGGAGFRVDALFGDVHRAPFEERSSPLMVFDLVASDR